MLYDIFRWCCSCLYTESDDSEVHDPLLVPITKDQTSMQSILQQTLDRLIDLNIYTIHSINRLSMYAPNTMPLGEKEITPVIVNIAPGELRIGSSANSIVLDLVDKALPLLETPVKAMIFVKQLEK